MYNEIHALSRRSLLAAMALAARADASGLKVGCQANAWPLQEGNFAQLLDVLREMRQIGYTGFECNIRFLRGHSGARKDIEGTGVQFIGAHTSLERWQPEDAAVVAELGGQRIVLSAAALSPDGRFSDAALREKASKVSKIARLVHVNGVKLAYHNHNDEFANGNAEVEGLARLLEPGTIDFLVDAGHGYLGGGDPAAFLTKHPKRVFGFHVKTFRGKEQVPLGSGDFGFEKLAEAIRSTNWKGWLINEEGGGTRLGNRAAVVPDREYIRRVFGV